MSYKKIAISLLTIIFLAFLVYILAKSSETENKLECKSNGLSNIILSEKCYKIGKGKKILDIYYETYNDNIFQKSEKLGEYDLRDINNKYCYLNLYAISLGESNYYLFSLVADANTYSKEIEFELGELSDISIKYNEIQDILSYGEYKIAEFQTNINGVITTYTFRIVLK